MARKQGRIRFAIVGAADAVGPYHVDVLQTVAGAELVAVVDRNTSLLEEKFPGLARFASQEEMYVKVAVDVEVIAVPTALHKPLAITAMRAGHHVMVEKPLGTDVADARQILAAARSRRRKLHPIAQRRLMVPAVKRAVATGAIGDVEEVALRWLRSSEEPPFAKRLHRGAFADLAVHHLSLLAELLGYQQPVALSGRAWRDRSPGEYLAHATIDFERFRATVETGWDRHIDHRPEELLDDECTLELRGSRGTIKVVLPTSEQRQHAYHQPIMTRWTSGRAPEVTLLEPAWTTTQCRYEEHLQMVKWVRDDKRPDPVDALWLMRMVDAFYTSSDAGGERVTFAG